MRNLAVATTGATVGSISTTETILTQYRIRPNTASIGATWRITIYGTQSTAGTITVALRCGTAGTTSDTQVGTITTALSTAGFVVEFLAFRTAASTMVSQGKTYVGVAVTINGGNNGSVTFSNDNILSVTILNSAGTTTVNKAIIEQIA